MKYRLVILFVLTIVLGGAFFLIDKGEQHQANTPQSAPADQPGQDAFKNFKIPH